MYSLGRNAALFAGWARINNDFDGSVARGTYGIDSSDSVRTMWPSLVPL